MDRSVGTGALREHVPDGAEAEVPGGESDDGDARAARVSTQRRPLRPRQVHSARQDARQRHPRTHQRTLRNLRLILPPLRRI